MAKIQSFRWSRLAERSAWERMRSRLSAFLFGLCFVGVMCNWWANFWMFGLPLLVLVALFVVCTADDYCRVAYNRYFFYKMRDRFVMEFIDYSGTYNVGVCAWEYKKIPGQGMVLLYCDEDLNWQIVSRQLCMKLGQRINRSSFLMTVPNIYGNEEQRLVVLSDGQIRSYSVRDFYVDKNLKVCFNKQEKEKLSESELKSEYMVVRGMKGIISIWRIREDAKTFFAAESVEPGPSLLLRKAGKVSVMVWEYEVYRYKEIYNGDVEALAGEGRLIQFKDGGFPFSAVISEFDAETKTVKEIYDGYISSIDFDTGEYTI